MNLSVVVLPAKVLASGKHKIRIALSHNCETRYLVTRFIIPSVKNLKNGKVAGKDIPDAEYINIQLNSLVQKMYMAYDTIDNAECYTCSQLLSLIEYKMKKSSFVTIEQISNEWLEYVKQKNTESTYKLYKIGISQLLEYFGKEYLLAMLNPKRVKDYENYINTRFAFDRKGEKLEKKLSKVTIRMRMDAFKFMVKYAESRKFVSYEIDPFVDCLSYTTKIRELFLDVKDLRKIRDAKFKNDIDYIVRDIFMLSFYMCGINYSDMLLLNLSKDEVSFNRQKNKNTKTDNQTTSFSIFPEARKIIDKYITKNGTLSFCGKSTKRQISNLLQKRISKIENELGLETHLIFYCARKTFSQFAYELGIQERTIKYCLGDSIKDRGIIMFYTKTNKQMADEAIRKVLDFVASDCPSPLLFNEWNRKEHSEQ